MRSKRIAWLVKGVFEGLLSQDFTDESLINQGVRTGKSESGVIYHIITRP